VDKWRSLTGRLRLWQWHCLIFSASEYNDHRTALAGHALFILNARGNDLCKECVTSSIAFMCALCASKLKHHCVR